MGYGLMWRSDGGTRAIELFGRMTHEIARTMAATGTWRHVTE
ncbi:hypothetical protein [Streptomyces crystallinus]